MIEVVFLIGRRFLLLGLLVSIYSGLLPGSQGLVFAQNDIRFERISTDEGLSQSSVTSIVQDQYGYLWIATLDGLNRYNGKEFKVYRNDKGNTKSLFTNHVKNLILDEDQNLWLVYDNAIARYVPKTDTFINYPISLTQENNTVHIYEIDFTKNGNVLLSTNRGILRFDIEKQKTVIDEAYMAFAGKKISHFHDIPEVGELVVTMKSAFIKVTESSEWRILFSDSVSLSAYVSEETQEIYFQTPANLVKYDLQKKNLEYLAEFGDLNSFDPNQNGLIKRSNGELWVYRNAIHVYDNHDRYKSTLVSVSQDPNSLSGNLISCIYESKDHVLWVGTNGFGLNKYDPQLSIFKYLGTYTDAPLSLSNNFVKSIYTSDDQYILVGTFSGLDVLDLKKNSSKYFPIKAKNGSNAQINKIVEDKFGTIWLCTTKGLKRFDGNKVSLSGIEMLDESSINIYNATSFDETSYVLTTSRGIYLFDALHRKVKKLNEFGSMVVGKWNNLFWIESESNVQILDEMATDSLKTFRKDDSDSTQFPNVQVKCFYTDSKGNLWIGTWGQGLVLFHSAREYFQRFSESDGLPNSVVYGILEDSVGNLWLSTNKGISVFDPHQKRVIRNVEKADGLQGNEFNTNAFFKSPKGIFYFGGINGLTYFNPEEALQIRSEIPKSILTGFFINQVRVDSLKDGSIISQYGDQRIVLSWDEQNFGFEVAGLGFNFPGRTRLKYKLENFDTDWSFIEEETRISYTNVSPGEYTLKVLASNALGHWEENGLTVQVIVNGPFWRSPYFLLFAVVVVVLVISVIYYWRVTSLQRMSLYLEKVVQLRTREVQIKNEEIATQNEEILSQNEELTTQSETLAIQNRELISIRESLENKVKERTKVLRNLNKKLIEQNIQLEQFSFITAHNIRGPLARIKGLIQLLPQKEIVEIDHLKKSVQNLDDIISDLGIIINIRDGVDRTAEPVSLKYALDHAMQALENTIDEKNAVIDLLEFHDLEIRGIAPYVLSIFYNLLHNALKYSSHQRLPIIKISTQRIGEQVVVVLSDNGIGIDMRYAEGKIFNLYQRFHANSEGKGFGLFLIKTQLEVMGGSIKVSSELGSGTTFTITFK